MKSKSPSARPRAQARLKVAEANITMYDAPRTLYLVRHYSGAYPQMCENVIGETSRSYVSCDYEHGPFYRHSKKDFRVITEVEYSDLLWVRTNRYKLSKAVEDCADPAILRQIAALVGHEEKKGA